MKLKSILNLAFISLTLMACSSPITEIDALARNREIKDYLILNDPGQIKNSYTYLNTIEKSQRDGFIINSYSSKQQIDMDIRKNRIFYHTIIEKDVKDLTPVNSTTIEEESSQTQYEKNETMNWIFVDEGSLIHAEYDLINDTKTYQKLTFDTLSGAIDAITDIYLDYPNPYDNALNVTLTFEELLTTPVSKRDYTIDGLSQGFAGSLNASITKSVADSAYGKAILNNSFEIDQYMLMKNVDTIQGSKGYEIHTQLANKCEVGIKLPDLEEFTLLDSNI